MAANDIKAGGAFVEIFLKGNIGAELKKLEAKLKQFGDNILSIGKKVAGLGVAITAPFILAAKKFADAGSEIYDASKRTGVSAEKLSLLKLAAEESGAQFEDLEKAITKTTKNIFEADNGNKAMKESLNAIGLSIADLKGLSPDQQFLKVTDALAGLSDQSAVVAHGTAIMGKGFTSLLPLIGGGAHDVRKMMSEFKSLGLEMSTADAIAADEFGDTLDTITAQLSKVTQVIGGTIARAIQPFATSITGTLASVIEWAKANGRLIVIVASVGVGLLAAGSALITFGLSLKIVAAAIGGFSSLLSFAKLGLGLLMNPIVLIGAGLVGLAAYFLFFTDTGRKALGWLEAKFSDLWKSASETFSGIADALQAGDMKLAAEILWAGIQIVFAKGKAFLETTFAGIQIAWETLMNGMTVAWIRTIQGLKSFWLTFKGWHEQAVAGTSKVITKMMVAQDINDEAFARKRNGQKPLTAKEINQRFADADKLADQANAKAQKQIDDEKAALTAQTDAELAAAEQVHQSKLTHIGEEETAAIQSATDAEAAAKKKLSELHAKATDELLNKRIDDELNNFFDFENEAKFRNPEGPDGAKLSSTIKANGLFNAAGIQGLQGGATTFEAIRDATKETAKNTKKIADKKLVFGK